MINLPFIMGLIGAIVGLIIGILVFGEIASAIDCPGEGAAADGTDVKTTPGYSECMRAESTAWTVLGILPVHVLLLALCGLRRDGRQAVAARKQPRPTPSFFYSKTPFWHEAYP